MSARRRASALAALLIAAAVAAFATRDPPVRSPARDGKALFTTRFTPEQGLGPLFNERACSDCHLEPALGGVGPRGIATVLRVGRLSDGRFDPLAGRGGPVAQAHAVAELGVACARAAGVPAAANLTSVRNTPPLFGAGLIDAIPERAIRAAARRRPGGVSGRPNLVRGPDGHLRVGRFGWKAETPTLELMVAEALRSELGITSALAPGAPLAAGATRCPGESEGPELDAQAVEALTAFVAGLAAPLPRGRHAQGRRVFHRAGCASCHLPALEARGRSVPLYSDLLLHDMGASLDDGVVQGAARGADWRTTPLWGLSDRPRYLHDGRAETLEAAIAAHGGEAAAARRRFLALAERERRDLLAFLRTL